MRTLATLLLLSLTANAAIVLEKVTYKDGDTVLEGAVAYDDQAKGKRPGVLVVHQWMGVTDHERTMAKRLAELGHVAFVADIYGQGIRPKNAQEARTEATKYRGGDGKLFRQRLHAGLAALKAQKNVDATKLGAIGFCFGGGGVLELARSGADVKGVVSFHGGLKTKAPAQEGKVMAKVLVCHGADDPLVPDEDVVAFLKEMRAAKVDFQLNAYGGAVHSFTQPSANRKGVAEYHEKAAKRSWRDMKGFFAECFR
ncbi:MAG: dienelactone hydrolase family protein [Planctomycetota bacterium]|jgi:dienelactone hydrolase